MDANDMIRRLEASYDGCRSELFDRGEPGRPSRGDAMSKPLSALRVGVDAAPPPPLCYGVPGNPGFKGFEVDLMHALAARMERPLTFHASLVDRAARSAAGWPARSDMHGGDDHA